MQFRNSWSINTIPAIRYSVTISASDFTIALEMFTILELWHIIILATSHIDHLWRTNTITQKYYYCVKDAGIGIKIIFENLPKLNYILKHTSAKSNNLLCGMGEYKHFFSYEKFIVSYICCTKRLLHGFNAKLLYFVQAL